MSRSKEIAKFACGAEALHAVVHAYLWFSGTTLTLFGITGGPVWNLASTIGNAMVAVVLGVYAWGRKPKSTPAHK